MMPSRGGFSAGESGNNKAAAEISQEKEKIIEDITSARETREKNLHPFVQPALNLPAAQAVQAEPSTPVYPGTQVQLFHHDERGGEAVNAGQELSTPVQHHVLGPHGEQAALATP